MPLVNVETEIVLPADMTVRESHDIALALQHKIESLPEVERAFVHVRTAYETRQ
jgi:divalent metal cation (Fe/Co/Zn/Cd) transporter